MEQQLGSARTPSGVEVAYATAGHGRPLLFVGGWLSHLELSWALPAERACSRAWRRAGPCCATTDRAAGSPTGARRPSPRWSSSSTSWRRCSPPPAWIAPTSWPAPSAYPLVIAWAARGTRRRSTGWCCTAGGRAGRTSGRRRCATTSLGLVAANWGLGADVLTDIFAPDASAGTRAALSAYQREASSPETAAALLRLCYQVDVTASLGQVQAPTLVVHRDEDRAAPLAQARLIAAAIPGARLEVLPGRSHLPYAGDAAPLVHTIRSFLGLPGPRADAGPSLTARQREVAALVADGLHQPGDRRAARDRGALGRGPPRADPAAPRRAVPGPGRRLVGGDAGRLRRVPRQPRRTVSSQVTGPATPTLLAWPTSFWASSRSSPGAPCSSQGSSCCGS